MRHRPTREFCVLSLFLVRFFPSLPRPALPCPCPPFFFLIFYGVVSSSIEASDLTLSLAPIQP